MKMRIFFGLIGFFTLSFIAHAEFANIQLGGGQAQPHRAYFVGLNKLLYGIKYNVSCNIHGTSRRPLAIQALANQEISDIYVNGVNVSRTNGMITLIYPLNSLEVYGAMQDGLIMILNLDNFDTIIVENCVASRISNEVRL